MSKPRSPITELLKSGEVGSVICTLPPPATTLVTKRVAEFEMINIGSVEYGITGSVVKTEPHVGAPAAEVGNENQTATPSAVSVTQNANEPQIKPHKSNNGQAMFPNREDLAAKMRLENEYIGLSNRNVAVKKQAENIQKERFDASMINLVRRDLLQQMIITLETSRAVDVPFPFEVFPMEAQELIQTMSSGSEARKELTATGLLGGISAATQGNWYISDSSTFTQPLTMYIAASASSGFGKSTICDVLVAPFKKHESSSAPVCDGGQGLREIAMNAGKAALKKTIEKKVAKGATIRNAMDGCEKLQGELRELSASLSDSCTVSRLLYRTTMEQLPFEMARRKGAAAIVDPEGGLLTMINGRKNDILLKGFDGESFESSTRTSGKIRIDNAFLSITSFVQPSKLIAFCAKKEAADHGVHPRFLMMLAKPEMLRKDVAMPNINGKTAWYDDLISCLLSSERSGDVAPQNEIRLSKAAEQRLFAGVRDLLQNRDKGDGVLGSFESRLLQHTKNISGILLLMHRGRYFLPEGDGVAFEVDDGLMNDALKVMQFFHAHARVILSPEFANGLHFAQKILRWLQEDEIDWFSARDAHRAIGSGRCNMDQVRIGLSELERCNYVRRLVSAKKCSIYAVHPSIRFLPKN